MVTSISNPPASYDGTTINNNASAQLQAVIGYLAAYQNNTAVVKNNATPADIISATTSPTAKKAGATLNIAAFCGINNAAGDVSALQIWDSTNSVQISVGLTNGSTSDKLVVISGTKTLTNTGDSINVAIRGFRNSGTGTVNFAGCVMLMWLS